MAYLSSHDAADSSVIKKLAEQALSRSVGTVEPLGGLIAHNFEVDHRHILKIASPRSCIEDWKRLTVNAPVLQQHLSVQIPIPMLHVLQHGKDEIYALSYEKLPGMTISREKFADAADAFKKDYIVKLNEQIYELHKISPDVLPIRPPTVFEQATDMLFNNKKIRKYVPELTKYLFPYSSDCKVLLHTDLHTENICFDGKKITGILDFDSLSVGHPIFEFRPKLYKNETDLSLMLNDYITKHPSEISKPIAKDFLIKFHTLYFLFFMMSLVKGNKKNKTRFEDVLRMYNLRTSKKVQ